MKAKQKTLIKKLKKRLRRHIKLAVVPHKTNQYRPHLIRRHGIVIVLIAIIGLQLGYNAVTAGVVLGSKASASSQKLLEETNRERSKNDLKALTVDERLSKAASLKANDMFKQQYWAHSAPDGTTPWQWFERVGYSYSYAGENLAKNFHSANIVTAAWMASAEHRENMLSKHFTQVGFAVVEGKLQGEPATIIVALYGAPPSQAAVAGLTSTRAAEASLASMGMVTQLGLAVQALTPAAIGALVLALLAAIVALGAHLYREKMPKRLRESWYRHHGIVKAGGMTGLCLMIVFLYSGGSI